MKQPTIEQAEKWLQEAKEKGPGPFTGKLKGSWASHAKNAGIAAREIAEKTNHLNSEIAYIMGILHDIGRIKQGKKSAMIKHAIDGYFFLKGKGYDDIAKICLTHSFPDKKIGEDKDFLDCSKEELEFIKKFIAETKYDDYDRLIQLCDMISLHTGFTILEQRFVNITLRYETNEAQVDRLRKQLKLKYYFDDMIGESIYNVLPGIAEHVLNYSHKSYLDFKITKKITENEK